MNIPKPVQQTLAARALYTARIDGQVGAMTVRALMAAAAGSKSVLDVDSALAQAFWRMCVDAEITTRLRLLHAIAQACVSAYADADDLVGVTRKINGGLTGLDDRQLALGRLKAVWPAG